MNTRQYRMLNDNQAVTPAQRTNPRNRLKRHIQTDVDRSQTGNQLGHDAYSAQCLVHHSCGPEDH
eukprot:3419938-Rhodomonas_salina.2